MGAWVGMNNKSNKEFYVTPVPRKSKRDLSDTLKHYLGNLIQDIKIVAGYDELPLAWKRMVASELQKTTDELINYKGVDEAIADPKIRHAMRLIIQYQVELSPFSSYNSSHNPAEYIRLIAKKTGYSERQVRRHIDSYRDYNKLGPDSNSRRTRASIAAAIRDSYMEEILNVKKPPNAE